MINAIYWCSLNFRDLQYLVALPCDTRGLETLRQMVAAGLGLTLLPRLAAVGPFGAACRRSTTRGEAIAAVCTVIERTAR